MMSLKKIWSEKYLVNWYDTDLNGQIKMSAIANYLQESAWRHANHLGFGFEDARKRNEFWVIVSLMVKMTGYPEWGQVITVETWPKGIDRLFAFRDFKILSDAGTILGAATSTWMILDLDTRRPKNVDIVKPALHLASHQDVLEENPPFLLSLKEVATTEMRQVRFSEVDQHGHVNNTRYIDWCIDALSAEWHRIHRIRGMVINYLSEVKADEVIKIATGPGKDQSVLIQGTKVDGRRGDEETGRKGDKETGGQGEKETGKGIFRTRMDWEGI